MDAIDLLNSDLAELPRTEREGSYGERLRGALDAYSQAVAQLSGRDFASGAIRAALPRIQELSAALLAVHRAVLDGRSDQAHTEMKRALAAVATELAVLRSQPLDRERLGHVFRLREAPYSERVDRGGIFHMPFERRHKVTPKRYSLLGLPMLYVGSTLLVCWEEPRRPSFDHLWVAAMRLKDGATVRLLDFGYRPALLAALLDKTQGVDVPASRFAVAHATLWPLIAACSFPRQFDDAAFIEEYIVPQQVVAQLVETGDFDGVRYFSNRVHEYGGEFLNLNYVFPARPGLNVGPRPKLSALFEITPPMPLPMVKLLGPPLNQGKPLLNSRTGVVELYAGHKVAYQYTEFADIESHLLVQDFQPVR
jgi:hypothetical protein